MEERKDFNMPENEMKNTVISVDEMKNTVMSVDNDDKKVAAAYETVEEDEVKQCKSDHERFKILCKVFFQFGRNQKLFKNRETFCAIKRSAKTGTKS